MLPLVEEIFSRDAVTDDEGNIYPLADSETPHGQCVFLQRMLREVGASVVYEDGLAYGVSALAIGEVLADVPGARFISIDPFQAEHYRDIGLLNLERAGFDRFTEFHREQGYMVTPRLMADGVVLDLAYLDFSKVFDVVLVEASYLVRLLRVGGLLVMDDCDVWPGVRRAARWLSRWPHLEVYATHGTRRPSRREAVGRLVGRLPSRLTDRLIAPDVIETERDIGINARCIVLRKVGDDTRHWSWDAYP